MYAEYEEQYGLLNHAFQVYDRMILNVEEKGKVEAYNIYIAKVAQYLGVTKTRPIFEVLCLLTLLCPERDLLLQEPRVGADGHQVRTPRAAVWRDRPSALHLHPCEPVHLAD